MVSLIPSLPSPTRITQLRNECLGLSCPGSERRTACTNRRESALPPVYLGGSTASSSRWPFPPHANCLSRLAAGTERPDITRKEGSHGTKKTRGVDSPEGKELQTDLLKRSHEYFWMHVGLHFLLKRPGRIEAEIQAWCNASCASFPLLCVSLCYPDILDVTRLAIRAS